MREIKFRAWDREGQKYVGEEVSIVRGQFVKSSHAASWWSSAAELINGQQYTGIADVYEDDYCIIRAEEPYFDENMSMDEDWELRGKIVFEDFAFWLITNDGFHFWLGNDFDEIEVIGNIYENPELLEAEK